MTRDEIDTIYTTIFLVREASGELESKARASLDKMLDADGAAEEIKAARMSLETMSRASRLYLQELYRLQNLLETIASELGD